MMRALFDVVSMLWLSSPPARVHLHSCVALVEGCQKIGFLDKGKCMPREKKKRAPDDGAAEKKAAKK